MHASRSNVLRTRNKICNKQEGFKINYGQHDLTKTKIEFEIMKENRDLEWG